MSSTTATRQRRFWLVTSFLVPIVSLGISGAQAQLAPRRASHRVQFLREYYAA